MTTTGHRPTLDLIRPGIGYDHADNFPGWDAAPDYLTEVITTNNSTSVLEVGSGAEPTLTSEQFAALPVGRYTTNDIDAEELKKAPAEFDALHADLAARDCGVAPQSYDLVFSRMVNEHIHDGETYHKNIYDILQPGGLSVHCFATLYNAPMLVNKLTPHWFSEALVKTFHPRIKENQGIFPAHYSWSRGPTPKMVDRFEAIGYEIERYTGYFGHFYYRTKLGPLHRLEMRKTDWLLDHPTPAMCAYGVIELRKPSA